MATLTGTRRYPRMKSPEGLGVAWQTTTQRLVSRVETLGLGGLFIRTHDPPATGTIIRLLIDIPGGECGPARLYETSNQAKEWAWRSSTCAGKTEHASAAS